MRKALNLLSSDVIVKIITKCLIGIIESTLKGIRSDFNNVKIATMKVFFAENSKGN